MNDAIEIADRLPPRTPPTSSGSAQIGGEHVRSWEGSGGSGVSCVA